MGLNPAEILNQPRLSLTEIYVQLQEHFEEIYGEQTVVVIEVGSFFEIYGIDNEKQKVGKPKEIAEILNLQLTKKNKNQAGNDIKNPLLAGFPIATFDRYIARLLQEDLYTVVIIRQRGNPPKIERYVDRIFSPGVNFEYASSHGAQLLCALSIEQSKDSSKAYTIGYASIDITTGKSSVVELHSPKEDPSYALDEIYTLTRGGSVKELVLFHSKHQQVNEVLSYLEISDSVPVHSRNKEQKVAYQNALFSRCFENNSMLSATENLSLERTPLASQALCQLIDFVIDHDSDILLKLQKPELLKTNQFLYLGNNPLEQLDIISDIPHKKTVLKHIDYTSTSIGKRLLTERMIRPIVDSHELERRYDLAEQVESIQEQLHTQLRQVYDLERIIRRIALSRLHPFEMNFLYDSLLAAKHITELLQEQQAKGSILINQQHNIENQLDYIQKTFAFEHSAKVSNQTISRSFFQPGVDKTIDELTNQLQASEKKLVLVQQKIIELIEQQTGKDESNFVVIKQLDKDGHYISISKSRFALIEPQLRTTFVSIDGTVHAFEDFSFRVQTGNVKVTANIIDQISKDIVSLQQQLVAAIREQFCAQQEMLHAQFHSDFVTISKGLAEVDVALSTAKSAQKLNLNRPTIIQSDEQVLDLVDLRHPLGEAREENGIYIPNSLALGNDELKKNGNYIETEQKNIRAMLLYGINSSGKSSLMKSLGIAVVLAQAGYYVPASSMRFTLVKELFTRIIAQDNLSKGLSSFAVEMLELKHIFARAGKKSLILADEISHGTETLSALAIVAAAIRRLSDLGSLFVCTTHLHQLVNMPQIHALEHIVSVHLSIHYDKEQDLLLFDRTLKAGGGSSIYGLEFAQSLHMDELFLRNAVEIRKELANEYSELELLTKKQTSLYNKNLYVTVCHVCNNPMDETHHINPQELADNSGNIGHFHKDHKYNLVALCTNCHNKLHRGEIEIEGYKMTNKGLRLQVKEK